MNCVTRIYFTRLKPVRVPFILQLKASDLVTRRIPAERPGLFSLVFFDKNGSKVLDQDIYQLSLFEMTSEIQALRIAVNNHRSNRNMARARHREHNRVHDIAIGCPFAFHSQ